jgi:hypothetical protein
VEYRPNDLNSIKILICYLLYNLENKIDSEALYEISVGSGIINYFYYSEALDELIINDTVYSKADENGVMCFSLSEKGKRYVKDFSTYVQLSFRNRIMYSAIQYKARQTQNAILSVDYDDEPDGCRLRCSTSDHDKKLIEFGLLTQNRTEAELIAEKISDNPSVFYSSFIEYILHNKSADYDAQ